jgi:tetratricopeptide (TPR) repeat protein
MEKNGQLNFSDDAVLQRLSEIYELIESGNFSLAMEKSDALMDANPDYPGLADCYRTAKFWHIRKTEMETMAEGRERAEFLIEQWNQFARFAADRKLEGTAAFKAAMRSVFLSASENYKIAFKNHQDTSRDCLFLQSLGECFLRLEEYKSAIDTLEYAKATYRSDARLLSVLGAACYNHNDIPKSMHYFREAFFINPSDIDLELVRVKPIDQAIHAVNDDRPNAVDVREWIPVYAYIHDIFYVKKNISIHTIETIQREVYNLEQIFQKMTSQQLEGSSIMPRLINKYLWLMDYYELQSYSFDNIMQIRDRIISIDKNLFSDFFASKAKKR